MKVGIIGFGVVGGATAEVFRRLGHTVMVLDSDAAKMELACAEGFAPLSQHGDVNALFVCVPETRVRQALAAAPAAPVTAIRSTVLPGTTARLSHELGRPLAHVPEFLREATALSDAMNPAVVVIGCDDAVTAATLRELFEPLRAPIAVVSPVTSEMAKLVLNAYLHTLVSFWNEINLICGSDRVESHVIGKLCGLDPRVSSYGASVHGKPVDGRCLPKDLEHLIAHAKAAGHAVTLLSAVQQANHQVAKRNGRTNGRVADWPALSEAKPRQLSASRVIEES